MLKDILVVTGKPGLYKLVSKGANYSIVESLIDKKRFPVYTHDKIVSIGASYIYTNDGEVSVSEVLASIKEKEESGTVSIDVMKAEVDELRAYLAEVLPNYNRERVYPNDIKKLLKWYDLLIAIGITDFSQEEETNVEATKEEKETTEEEKEAQKTNTLNMPSVAKSAATKRKDLSMTTVKSAKTPKSKPINAIPKKSIVGSKRGS